MNILNRAEQEDTTFFLNDRIIQSDTKKKHARKVKKMVAYTVLQFADYPESQIIQSIGDYLNNGWVLSQEIHSYNSKYAKAQAFVKYE